LEFKVKAFDELTVRELYEIVRSRTEIFLLEQRIICQDFDGVDYRSLHCFIEDEGRVVAYLRAYTADGGAVKIGRVLSLTHGIGLGTRLLELSVPKIKEKFNCSVITLHAQEHAKGFYQKLGFTVTSPVFLEEGIPHVSMTLDTIQTNIKGDGNAIS
jgi:ElaA protein